MKLPIRTYYKALLLLMVFSSNTLISFACSYSSFFHSSHHHKTSSDNAHRHDDQKHTHDHSGNHHEQSNGNSEQKENCCSTAVVELQKAEKAISRNIDAPDTSLITLLSSELIPRLSDLLYWHLQKFFTIPEIRWRPPATIQDVRIVIQSFQI